MLILFVNSLQEQKIPVAGYDQVTWPTDKSQALYFS